MENKKTEADPSCNYMKIYIGLLGIDEVFTCQPLYPKIQVAGRSVCEVINVILEMAKKHNVFGGSIGNEWRLFSRHEREDGSPDMVHYVESTMSLYFTFLEFELENEEEDGDATT